MNPLEFPILAGIVGSVLHVVSGPDHLVAVAPFAIENKRKAWKIGLMWGVGHLAGMLLIGVLVMLFKDLIPYETISEIQLYPTEFEKTPKKSIKRYLYRNF